MAESETESQSAEKRDPRYQRAKAVGAGDKGRELLEHVHQGATLDEAEESMALDYLLGSPEAAIFDVPVDVDTPAGRRPMKFVIQAQDGKVIERFENLHRNQTTGLLDQVPASCAIVAEATIELVAGSRTIDPRGSEWLTMKIVDATGANVEHKFADPGVALARRFRGQQGLIVFLANEIRRVSGYDLERVGQAQRKLVHASLD